MVHFRRRSATTGILASIMAVALLLAVFVTPRAEAAGTFPTTYQTGTAHLEVTELGRNRRDSYDLPLYPPPSGAREDLLQVGPIQDTFGFRPAQTEWFESIGRMQFWFADLASASATPSGAAPFFGLFGPLKLGAGTAGQLSATRVSVTLPGQPFGAENQSVGGGSCTIDIAGDPNTTLHGTVSCKKLTSVFMNGQIPQPPDIDLEATFTVATGPTAPETTNADIAVDHVEVVQTVQDPGNTVPLVADKSTVARVFLRVNDEKPAVNALVTIELFGLRSGNAAQPRLGTLDRVLTITRSIDRETKGQGTDFALPPTWTSAGDLGLQATVTLRDPWHETKPDDNDWVGTFTFAAGPILVAGWQAICLGVDTTTKLSTRCPAGSALNGVSAWSTGPQQLYPVPDGGFRWFQLPGPPWVWAGGINSSSDESSMVMWLGTQYAVARAMTADEGRAVDQIVGITDFSQIDWKESHGGAAGSVGWAGASSPGAGHAMFLSTGHRPSDLAHELGHNMGFGHMKGDGAACDDPAGPYDPGSTAIGEVGFDVAAMTPVRSTANDVMSYCAGQRWISPVHYRALLAGNLKPPSASNTLLLAVVGPRAAASGATQQLILTGTVSRSGLTGTLDPAFVLPAQATTAFTESTAGTACLRLSGADGELLRRCFEPAFLDPETGATADPAAFSATLPFIAGTTHLDLIVGSKAIASLDLPKAVPAVTASAPTTTTWSTPQRLTWTVAGGAAGAAPRVTVLYSPDGGRLWLPFAPDAPADGLTVDPATLVAGSSNLFRVLVRDGLATTSTDIGPVAVPDAVGRGRLPDHDPVPVAAVTGTGSATAGPTIAPGGSPPGRPAGPNGVPPAVIAALVALALLGGAGLVFAVARGSSRRRPANPGPWTPPIGTWQQGPPGGGWQAQPPPSDGSQAPPGPLGQPQPPPGTWLPGQAQTSLGPGVPGWVGAQQPPLDLSRPAAVVLGILGALDVAAFGVVIAAALIVASSVGETGPDPAFVAGVAALGLTVGVVAILGAGLAWRGQVAGRVMGLGFGVLAAFFSGAAVAEPLPGLPPALSVIPALAVLTGSLFVLGALLLAWRPRPRSPG